MSVRACCGFVVQLIAVMEFASKASDTLHTEVHGTRIHFVISYSSSTNMIIVVQVLHEHAVVMKSGTAFHTRAAETGNQRLRSQSITPASS